MEDNMEKYGVEEERGVNGLKTASNEETCPAPGCGKPLKVEANVRLCPEHGSKPFEA